MHKKECNKHQSPAMDFTCLQKLPVHYSSVVTRLQHISEADPRSTKHTVSVCSMYQYTAYILLQSAKLLNNQPVK